MLRPASSSSHWRASPAVAIAGTALSASTATVARTFRSVFIAPPSHGVGPRGSVSTSAVTTPMCRCQALFGRAAAVLAVAAFSGRRLGFRPWRRGCLGLFRVRGMLGMGFARGLPPGFCRRGMLRLARALGLSRRRRAGTLLSLGSMFRLAAAVPVFGALCPAQVAPARLRRLFPRRTWQGWCGLRFLSCD